MALILVTATVNLAGLRAGEYAYVDSDDPWMKEALEHTWIVVVDEPAAHPGSLAADAGPVHEDPSRRRDRP